MNAPRKILIIRLSSLGDILHAVPAVQSLRRTFPEARIDWLVEQRTSVLLSAVVGIDRIFTIDTRSLRMGILRSESWTRLWAVLRALRAERYDLSLDFQGLVKTGLLSLLCGATERLGFDRKLVREQPAQWFYTRRVGRGPSARHVVQLNESLAQAAGALRPTGRAELRARPEHLASIEDRLRQEKLSDFVVINPGGGWITKKWSPQKYGQLAERIASELGLPVVVTTGPGEEDLYHQIVRSCSDPVPRHFQVSFMELIPLLSSARLLIGGDTGPFHLACALGTPVVGIFGPTSPARNGPWSGEDEAVARTLSCSFCNGRTCPTSIECMDISMEEVFQSVQRRLARPAEGRTTGGKLD
jgi:lipopolysaccharide heptosyltransferase I